MRSVVCVARIGDMRNAYKILDGKPEEKRRDHSEDPGRTW